MQTSNVDMHPEKNQSSFLWLVFVVCMLVSSFVLVRYTATSPWFSLPPKPIGDGPDYDMLAVSINERGWWAALLAGGMRIDSSNPVWRAPYTEVSSAAASTAAPDTKPTYSDLLALPTQRRISTGRPPAFPFLVAAVYKVIGRGETGFAVVRTLLALCLAASISLAAVLSAMLAGRLNPARSNWIPGIAAAVTLLIGATNNTLRTYADDFLTEPLALLMMQGFVLCIVCERGSSQSGRRSRWAASGVLLGLLILCRSMFVLWLPGICLVSLVAARGRLRERLLPTIAMLLTAMLVCLAWWIRNYQVTEGYSPLGTKGTITLVGGYCDAALDAQGEWQFEPEQALRAQLQSEWQAANKSVDVDPFIAGTRFEVELARRSREEVTTWVRENVRSVPRLMWMRMVTHWNPYTSKILVWKFACLLGGLVLVLHRRREACWLLGLPLISTLVVACLYTVGGRFLVPLYGILFCLPSIALAQCLILVFPQRPTPVTPES